jgi:hypothetical protein
MGTEEDTAAQATGEEEQDAGDLSDMLQELRILLQGVQVLTAFLIILPFNEGFAKIDQTEKLIYLATFLCSISSLLLFSAPAAHHRLTRPLMNRVRFKLFATRMIIAGLVPLSMALVLATYLVIAEVVGMPWPPIVAGGFAVFLIGLWWILPLAHKEKGRF